MSKSEILSRLPPVERAVGYLNLDTRDWLNAAGVQPQTIDRINRATMRASHAIEVARGGSRKEGNLRRARDAMITYLNLMRFLCLHDHLSYAQFDEAERRVEQIQAGLTELERLALEEWPELELPPLRPPRAIAVPPPGDGTVPPADGSPPSAITAAPTDDDSSRSVSEEGAIDDDSDRLEDRSGEDALVNAHAPGS